jgi:CheY-like chemotaxis protein
MRSHQPPSSKPPRILIVDDIPQNVDLVRSLMQAEG